MLVTFVKAQSPPVTTSWTNIDDIYAGTVSNVSQLNKAAISSFA